MNAGGDRATPRADSADEAATLAAAAKAEKDATERLLSRDKAKGKTATKKRPAGADTEIKEEDDTDGDGSAKGSDVKSEASSEQSERSGAAQPKKRGRPKAATKKASACMRKPSASESVGHAAGITIKSMAAVFTRARAKECGSANTFACRAWTAAKKYCVDNDVKDAVRKATTSRYEREGRAFWNAHVGK